MSLNITATDLFCGAGGSSTGMVAAGIEVKMAANHWPLAIETHQTNHPTTDHDLADLRLVHPSQYPKTTIGWFSPECTSHSLAKGKVRKNIHQMDLWGNTKVDPAEERSRATMREVVEFTDYHRYEIVIVENVVDIRYWQYYEDWLTAMMNLGYDYRALYLNAQFFGVPQSRDRVYIVFWKKGNKAPDLDFRPQAVCPKHGVIEARQVFKKAGYQWGRYGDRRQYTYRCPKCGTNVQPFMSPAASVIDWTLPTPLIGDRKKSLKPKTLQRIRAGLEKFKNRAVMVNLQYMQAADSNMVSSPDEPFPTQTARQTLGLAIPPHVQALKGDPVYHNGTGMDEPLTTIIASAAQNWLVMPPFLMAPNDRPFAERSVEDPMPTQTTTIKNAIIVPPAFMLSYYNNATDGRTINDPSYTIAGRNNPALVIPPAFLTSVNHSTDRNTSADNPLPAVMPQANPAVVMPPFLMQYYTRNDAQSGTDAPIPTIPGDPKHALVVPPMIVPLRKNSQPMTVDNPLHTIVAGGGHHALIQSGLLDDLTITDEIIDACGFRMLTPEELKLGMSFPKSYIILGNNRDQVRQVGNAVCPNVAEWIVQRCVESLQ